MEERRRSPRRTAERQSVAVSSVESVRVLELSPESVLLESPTAIEPEPRCILRLSLDGAPIAAEIEILRVCAALTPTAGVRVAAHFLAITPNHRQLIERFISQ